MEINNSFIYTLCERLAEQFSFKHILFGDSNRTLLDFEQLKTLIIESMSTCTGYIIEHFPTSFDEIQRFQKEVKISVSYRNLKKSFLCVEDWSLLSINLYR